MKTIKNMFDDKIDKNRIKRNIINKIEKPKKNYYKWSIVAACLIAIFSINITLINKNSIDQTNNLNKDIIKFNSTAFENSNLDVGWDFKETTLEEFSKDYPWIKNIKIPEEYVLVQSEMMYEYGSEHKYIGNILGYRTEESLISIYFDNVRSQVTRCMVFYNLEELENSTINNIKVKLIEIEDNSSKGHFIAFFKKDGLNFDIEMENGNKEDFINLIRSIIN